MALEQLSIETARAADEHLVRGLLAGLNLPLEGLSDQFPRAYAVARARGALVGVAGLESYGDVGLLRSVAVDLAVQSRGVARELVLNRLASAREQGLSRVFLLTTTAELYFERLGFSRADRALAPPAISRSPEFAFACPASAACLVYAL